MQTTLPTLRKVLETSKGSTKKIETIHKLAEDLLDAIGMGAED